MDGKGNVGEFVVGLGLDGPNVKEKVGLIGRRELTTDGVGSAYEHILALLDR